MKKEKIFMKSAGTRGYSRLARVMTLAVMLLAMAATAWAANTVTWTTTQLGTLAGKTTATIDGVTITTTSGQITVNSERATFDGATFSVEDGNITKIVLKSISGVSSYPAGWTISNNTEATWTGSAKSVSCGYSGGVYNIEFTIETVYTVTMAEGTVDATNWTISPTEAAEGKPITATYSGTKHVKSVTAVTKAAEPAATVVDLSKLTGDYEAQNGETLTGTLGGNYKVSIADGATVTLDGVTINGVNESNYLWAGITCAGEATIILKGTNTVKGFYENYPGIYVPSGKTLTIQGDGSLTASPFDGGTDDSYGAGIGGVFKIACGNITIAGGTINAKGGYYAAGIGGGQNSSCGDITITGGTINATGGDSAAGIGSGYAAVNKTASCGNITIANTVTKVTATKGDRAPNSIGKGRVGNNGTNTCGTVTIGGTVYWDGSAYQNGGDTYLTTSPLTYQPAN